MTYPNLYNVLKGYFKGDNNDHEFLKFSLQYDVRLYTYKDEDQFFDKVVDRLSIHNKDGSLACAKGIPSLLMNLKSDESYSEGVRQIWLAKCEGVDFSTFGFHAQDCRPDREDGPAILTEFLDGTKEEMWLHNGIRTRK